ncbi:hypothetical protein VAR608DRAFT_0359 [Variovorax sp. HW608]|uniref:AAA family ATPase n=1 Tax=Variovorax sp. HW608 TaxID=1034889 RepID=UPI00081FE7C6|nr:AAA family ATPase [Variovorax sp. HW608]SCK09608.1 hypothetical protein VAR608DRAFT_0359 [Variovorax sp. HW608]
MKSINPLLLEGPARESAYASHPVVSCSAHVATPVVEVTEKLISQVVFTREVGHYWIGEPRIGKSFAIDLIADTLAKKFPEALVQIWIAKDHARESETNFYADVLLDLGHGAVRGNMSDKRTDVIQTVIGQCRSANCKTFVLIADEAQNWGEFELGNLKGLVNDIVRIGKLTVVTIFFAHPMIETERTKMLKFNRTDLIDRFLAFRHTFGGIGSGEDLKTTLDAYDNPRRHQYPEDSGICFSQFFLPKSYGFGWRLGQEAEAAWKAFVAAAPLRVDHRSHTASMNIVAKAIRNFFFLAQDREEASLFGADIWTTAFRQAQPSRS